MAAEGASDVVVARGQQVGRHEAFRAVQRDLAMTLGGPAGIVADDDDDRCVVAQGSVQLHDVIAGRAIASEGD